MKDQLKHRKNLQRSIWPNLQNYPCTIKKNYPLLFWNVGSQISIWLIIRSILSNKFHSHSGLPIYFRPIENLSIYLSSYWTIILVTIFALGVFLVYKRRNVLNRNLLLFLTILFPILLTLHIASGYPFEIRVFAEILPVFFISIIPRTEQHINSRESFAY